MKAETRSELKGFFNLFTEANVQAGIDIGAEAVAADTRRQG